MERQPEGTARRRRGEVKATAIPAGGPGLADQLAEFVVRARWEDLSVEAREALKIRVLDSLGCAIGALESEPVTMLHEVVDDFGGTSHCTLLGGGCSSPDRAALLNGALVRYLDFNDSYLAKGETCHPSDALAALLAAAEYAGASGRNLLTALAVAYQVQCRLSDVAPVRDRGFDHTVQGAYAVAAGVSKVLALDAERTANAVAIAGTAFNALRVTRTGVLSHWKGLAAPWAAAGATLAAFLARRGITGPCEVFEGNKGLMESITGPFVIDWSREDLERVRRTVLKSHNGEIHGQSTVEAVLDLRSQARVSAAEVARVEVDIFDVAYKIIGGGEEGDKHIVATKEQADHSLPYMVAAALIDGCLLPAQYTAERILRPDVQDLLRRVVVRPSSKYSRRFPGEHPCRVRIVLRDRRELVAEKCDYEGFHTRPMMWDAAAAKFGRLAAPFADVQTQARIVDAVLHLDEITAVDLCGVLAKVEAPRVREARATGAS
jgi:2-methylcitrate dehydratase